MIILSIAAGFKSRTSIDWVKVFADAEQKLKEDRAKAEAEAKRKADKKIHIKI